jgi:hypothetical protein
MDTPTFIGPKEVKTVETLPEKHNGTIELVKVTYSDDSTETMTKKLYDVSTKPAASDLTALRDQRIQPVVKSILELLLDWGVGLADINFITQSIAMSINSSMNEAGTKLWGKPENTLNLVEIDKVLKDSTSLDKLVPPQA